MPGLFLPLPSPCPFLSSVPRVVWRGTFCGLFGQCLRAGGSSQHQQPTETFIEGTSPTRGTRTVAMTTTKLHDIPLTYVKVTQDDQPRRDAEAVANDAI